MTNRSKDPNIQGRKYNGSPYLRMRKAKSFSRTWLRQQVRRAVMQAAAEVDKSRIARP